MKRILLALSLLAAGCAQNPATGGRMFSVVSKSQELEIGQQSAAAEIKRYGEYNPSSRITKYVTNLCRKVYGVTEMAAEPVQCIFLDSPTYNAWATPGYINVYRGFLPYVNSEAELAAVLAHEAGHINARHIAQHASKQMAFGLLASGVGIAVASQTENAQAANLAYTAAAMGATAAVMAYGRAHEHEADALGVRYMERAGYDKREAVNMVRGMQSFQAFDTQVEAAYNNGKVPESANLLGRLYASHPPTPDRLANVTAAAGGEPDGGLRLPAGIQPATTRNDPAGRKRFLETIHGLEVGPVRAYGIAGADYLAVPAKRFLWKLPQGYLARYTEAPKPEDIGEWRGVKPQSDIVFSASFVPMASTADAAAALTRAVPGLRSSSLTPISVGGAGGHTALMENGGRVFRIVAVPVAAAGSLAVIAFRYPDAATKDAEDGAVLAALRQSRIFTEDRARYFNPLEISVFTAARGDTVASRAAKLPAGALREEWFRALNNLTPDQELIPGQHYKTIADPNLSLI